MGQLTLDPGKWLVINCGKMPSDKNCKLVIQAPEGQRDDLLDAAVTHAVQSHGHKDSGALREELNKMVDTITV